MKLSKIKRAIQGSKSWVLVNRDDGGQWIGDGVALYAVPEAIDMTALNAPTILDIAPEKKAEYSIRVISDPPEWYDNLPMESMETVMYIRATVIYAGHQVEIMTSSDGQCAMVDAAYLAPCQDAEAGLGFALRRRNGPDGLPTDPVVVVYDDMTVCAMIAPIAAAAAREIMLELYKACKPGLTYVLGGATE